MLFRRQPSHLQCLAGRGDAAKLENFFFFKKTLLFRRERVKDGLKVKVFCKVNS